MKTELKLLATILLLFITANTFAQRSNRPTNRDRHAKAIKPLNPMGAAKWEWGIQCDCPSKSIIDKPSKDVPDSRDRRWKYKDYVCPNCSTVWRIKTNANTNEILRGPYIPMTNEKRHNDPHILSDSCYIYEETPTELSRTINGKEYPGKCITIKNQCKHEKEIYFIIRNEIDGSIRYYAIPRNSCGYDIVYGEYKRGFTHSREEIESTIGRKVTAWPTMQYCE